MRIVYEQRKLWGIYEKITYFFFLVILALSQTYITHAETDKSSGIERSIIKKIEWNNEQNAILIHSILLKKYPNQPIAIDYNFIMPIVAEGVEGPLTNNEARNFVYQTFPLNDDHIFGKKVKVFQDFSDQQNVSDKEINNAVEELRKQIELDWNNPQYSTEHSSWLNLQSIILGVLLLVILVLVFVMLRKRKRKQL